MEADRPKTKIFAEIELFRGNSKFIINKKINFK